MRTHVVVPGAEVSEREVQLLLAIDRPRIELLLEGAEETLDASVHPRTVRLGSLVADSQDGERQGKEPGREGAIVVGADGARQAVALDRVQERAEDGDRRSSSQCDQRDGNAAAVIDDAEDGMDHAFVVRLAGEVETPDAVGIHGFRNSPLPLSASLLNLAAPLSDVRRDPGLADGRRVTRAMHPIEGVCDPAAAGIGHVGLQPYDFLDHPIGFTGAKRGERGRHKALASRRSTARREEKSEEPQPKSDGKHARAKPRILQLRGLERLDFEPGDGDKVLGVPREDGQSALQCGGRDQSIGHLDAVGEGVFVDQAYATIGNRGREREHQSLPSGQAALQAIQFRLVAAALRELEVGDDRNAPGIDGRQTRSRLLVAASQPDQHIGVDQDHAPRTRRGARIFLT